MIIVVHKAQPAIVFATHTDTQLPEVLVSYPEADYGLCGTTELDVLPLQPIPDDTEEIRPTPEA